MNRSITATCSEVVELLLRAMYTRRGSDDVRVSFMYGPPERPTWDFSAGTEVFFERRKLVDAILHLRTHGAPFLRHLSISDIQGMLIDFVVANFWIVAKDTFLRTFECSYAERVSEAVKLELEAAISKSDFFTPRNVLTLYPLVPVRVASYFQADLFFFASPPSLSDFVEGSAGLQLASERFPPLQTWKGKFETPAAWLGVQSPFPKSSRKLKSAILGALALTPLPPYRHQFSLRTTFGGSCSFSDTIAVSFGNAHTPPMSEDIVVTEQDSGWLSILSGKLFSKDKKCRRDMVALEYFYRAWPLPPEERFPVLCMALDSIFGQENRTTREMIDAIRHTLGDRVKGCRLRPLMELRGDVIHGRAPDVYDAERYAKYYRKFGADPIFDLELVAAECLKECVLNGALVEHPDPNAQLIAGMREKGRYPQQFDLDTILSDACKR